jgi:hypothetical protein
VETLHLFRVSQGAIPRASRSLDVAGRRGLRSTPSGPVMDCRAPSAVGAPACGRKADTVPRPACPFRAATDGRNTRQSAKTLRSLAGSPHGQPLRARHPLPRPQESGLRPTCGPHPTRSAASAEHGTTPPAVKSQAQNRFQNSSAARVGGARAAHFLFSDVIQPPLRLICSADAHTVRYTAIAHVC